MNKMDAKVINGNQQAEKTVLPEDEGMDII